MRPPTPHLVAAGFALLVAVGGAWSSYASLTEKSVAAAALHVEAGYKTSLAESASSAQAIRAEIARNERLLAEYFISDTEIAAFAANLERKGMELGVLVRDVSTVSIQADGRPAHRITLTVSGTFDALMRMTGSIEYSPYDISIESLAAMHAEGVIWSGDIVVIVGGPPV